MRGNGSVKPQRILVVADSAIPVPPKGYGGTERVLGYLLKGLAERGYQTTLMGARGSQPPGRLVTFSDARAASKPARGLAKANFWARLVRELPRHDLLHSAARLDYVMPALRYPIPKVLKFQNPITTDQLDFIERHARGPTVLVGCGVRMIESFKTRGLWRPIHNAIEADRFQYQPFASSPPYLAFLGRLTPNKGAHTAIRVAREVGIKLVIGGNIGNADGDREYYESRIAPFIDQEHVEYIGEVDDAGKELLLGGAMALLNPIEWDEPFGNVNIEAFACGTPSIAFARGEIPVVIRHGVTGFLCRDQSEMIEAVRNIKSISRETCRREAVERFDVARMVDKFEEVYRWLWTGERVVPAHWAEP